MEVIITDCALSNCVFIELFMAVHPDTPLHIAASRNHEAVVHVILQFNCNARTTNNAGKTAKELTKNPKIISMITEAENKTSMVMTFVNLLEARY